VIAVGGGFLDAGDAVDVEHAVEDSALLGGRVAVVEEAAALEREPVLGPLLAVLLHEPAALAVQNLLGGQLDAQLDGLVAAAGGGVFHAAIAVRVAALDRLRALPVGDDLLGAQRLLLHHRDDRGRRRHDREALRSLLLVRHLVTRRRLVQLHLAHRPSALALLLHRRDAGDLVGDVLQRLIPDYVLVELCRRVWRGEKAEGKLSKRDSIDWARLGAETQFVKLVRLLKQIKRSARLEEGRKQ
jgi:hypothetical protein